jgi:hypothetical protein
VRKYTVVILNKLNIKKIKLTKTILKKFITKKNMWGMTVAIHSVLKKKKYKVKFSTSLILKNKNIKDNFKKKSYKKAKIIKKKEKKTHIEKYYNNPQCFVRKTIVVILNQLNIKKKIDKDNFGKNHKKNIKIMWGNTVAIQNVLKKKTTKLNS